MLEQTACSRIGEPNSMLSFTKKWSRRDLEMGSQAGGQTRLPKLHHHPVYPRLTPGPQEGAFKES